MTVLDLKSCREGWIVVRRTYQEKRLERSVGFHTGHNTAGSVRSLVANHVTEFIFFLLLDLLGNSENKRQPTGNQGSEKKKDSSSEKEMETGVPVTA